MIFTGLFHSSQNRLEGEQKGSGDGRHARARIAQVADKGSFEEIFADLEARDILSFQGYPEKIKQARQKSGEKDAVVCGRAKIGGVETMIFAMEPAFMMGSMGTVVGRKIIACFDEAIARRLPVVGFVVSGGARMQEGIFSLLQMAGTSDAVRRHSEAGLLYIAVLQNPTMGGVEASFAMEADIILAEPGARIGFAGPRVIEQTYHRKLPEGLQRAETVLQSGFIDRIVPENLWKREIGRILKIHATGSASAANADSAETEPGGKKTAGSAIFSANQTDASITIGGQNA